MSGQTEMALADEIERISRQFGNHGISIVDGMLAADKFSHLNKSECDLIIAALRRPAPTELADIDCEHAFIEACDEAGCAYDNEALLEAIAELKKRAALPTAAPMMFDAREEVLNIRTASEIEGERLARKKALRPAPTEPDLRSSVAILDSLDRIADDFREVEPCRHNNDNLISDLKIELAGLRAALSPAGDTGREADTITVRYNPCLAKLRDGEPFFVLLGRDKQAPNAIMTWANDREAAEGKSAWTEQARAVAYEMAAYSGLKPASPLPAARIGREAIARIIAQHLFNDCGFEACTEAEREPFLRAADSILALTASAPAGGWQDRLLERAISALDELTATVRGECPSLLNEDSGGNARLSIEIDAILTARDAGSDVSRAERAGGAA